MKKEKTSFMLLTIWISVAPGTALRAAIDPNDFKTEEVITTTNLLIMNWGYDGSWDDGRYSLDGLWNANSGDHQYRREMLINFAKK